ncbi:hypothetical protein NDU88_000772 [Pleurodeles waltl]|uniref:Uncharacterized protein n=1 Tax=Pleurodeles waltl TaxID=8319 RepID=A0AAV7MJ25_PLEWA|nr:hypothetical protein NDU88_000772 [Pleurodeles waltl]
MLGSHVADSDASHRAARTGEEAGLTFHSRTHTVPFFQTVARQPGSSSRLAIRAALRGGTAPVTPVFYFSFFCPTCLPLRVFATRDD